MPQDLPPSGGYEPVQYKVSPPLIRSANRQPTTKLTQSPPTAQPSRARVPPFILPLRHGHHLHLWTLQDRPRDQRAQVRHRLLQPFHQVPAVEQQRMETGFRLPVSLQCGRSRTGTGNSAFTGRRWADLLACYSELAREKMWSRIYLIPMLQAEEDRDLVRRTWADKAREKELMGGESKVYHSDR